MIDVVLHPGRQRSLHRRHPWVLSGAVARVDSGEAVVSPGELVRVLAAEGEVLGHGHFSPASGLRIRMLAFGKEPLPEDWLECRVAAAIERRRGDPLIGETDAVRLVNAEADGLPGLVADRYGDLVVARLTSAGMIAQRDAVAEALKSASAAAAGFERADTTAARREGVAAQQGVLWGEPPSGPVEIRERARRYRVDTLAGQKTGFYLDQRDARDLVQTLAAGRRTLDAFAYTGGFAVAAALGGASELTLVDSSAGALELAAQNVELNAAAVPTECVQADVFRFLRASERDWDLLVLDPPPLARQRRDVERAARGYKDLILQALRRAAPGARLLTFACSHHVGPELFRKIAFGASVDARRPVRLLNVLGQPADHPIALDHPEGAYLTGLLLEA